MNRLIFLVSLFPMSEAEKEKKMRSIGSLSSEDGSRKAPGRREGVEGVSAKGTWVPEMRKA